VKGKGNSSLDVVKTITKLLQISAAQRAGGSLVLHGALANGNSDCRSHEGRWSEIHDGMFGHVPGPEQEEALQHRIWRQRCTLPFARVESVRCRFLAG